MKLEIVSYTWLEIKYSEILEVSNFTRDFFQDFVIENTTAICYAEE